MNQRQLKQLASRVVTQQNAMPKAAPRKVAEPIQTGHQATIASAVVKQYVRVFDVPGHNNNF